MLRNMNYDNSKYNLCSIPELQECQTFYNDNWFLLYDIEKIKKKNSRFLPGVEQSNRKLKKTLVYLIKVMN